MMEGRHYWEENVHSVKYENFNCRDEFSRAPDGQLNFSTGGAQSEDEGDYGSGAGVYLKKGKQDPMSHRIIEKRRRDRMNNCLADLSRLIPQEYLKKGRGRVEKTEIIEMAIRHLKYLQDRANAAEQPNCDSGRDVIEHFQAGFQECVSEAVRFLVERHGCAPGDGLCLQMVAHLQAHCQLRSDGTSGQHERKSHSQVRPSSETSSSSQGYSSKGVIHPPMQYPDHYDHDAAIEAHYNTGRDKAGSALSSVENELAMTENGNVEPMPLDGIKCSPLRGARKQEVDDHHDDYLHSYKFKNCIERRFSRSQDNEAHDMSVRAGRMYSHKRRRAPPKPQPSASTTSASTSASVSGSASTEEARDHDLPDHPHGNNNQLVPVFALNSAGKYYIPLCVEYSCLSRHLPPCSPLSRRPPSPALPLHQITLHVNFQPCLHCRHGRTKLEPAEQDWQPL